jgi:hypothetical protein
MYTYLQLPNTSLFGQDYLRYKKKTFRDILSFFVNIFVPNNTYPFSKARAFVYMEVKHVLNQLIRGQINKYSRMSRLQGQVCLDMHVYNLQLLGMSRDHVY